jgi:hypothetical protein
MNKWCCEYNLSPMFKINEYEYIKPIEKLSKYYGNYYTELKNKIDKKLKKEPLPTTDINDQVMIEYIKCRPNCSVLTFWENAQMTDKYKKELFEILNKNGNVYYIKEIELNYFGGLSLLFQLYSTTSRMKQYDQIVYKAERLGFNKEKPSKLTIIVYELTNKKRVLTGSTSEFKSEIRNIWLKDAIKKTNFKPDQDEYPREYDFLHINDFFYEAVEYAQIYFNKNSLILLESQLLKRLMSNYLNKSFNYFNSMKKLLIDNFEPIDFMRLLCMSSIVLYSYGLRNMNDIDAIFLVPPKITDKQIKVLRSLDYLDVSIKGTKEYTKDWEKELNRRAKMWGEDKIDNMVLNPEHYYYFMGIKIQILEYDILRRIERKRPASYADIIAMNILMKMKIPLKIPKQYTEYDSDLKKDLLVEVNPFKYKDTVKFYLGKRYNLNNVNVNNYLSN